MADAQTQEVRVVKDPDGVIKFRYAVFSSDGKTVYVADSGGGTVYAVDTATGNIVRHWMATQTGEDIYAQRISCLTISPDDRWIAVGTRPEGLVFVFDAASEGKPIMINGAGTLIVSFSPDSRYLATVGAGIKVWDFGPSPSAPKPPTGDTKPAAEPTTRTLAPSVPSGKPIPDGAAK